MRDIAKLLFGHETGILSGLFPMDDPEGFGLAERARRAGEWCGTTPGRDSAARQAADAVSGPGRRRRIVIRER